MTLFDDTFSHPSQLIKFEVIKGRKECGKEYLHSTQYNLLFFKQKERN